MTENEAIEIIKKDTCNNRCIPQLCNDGCMYGDTKCAFSMAIKALEEVQQYHQIGKISTCKNAVEICKAMIERGIDPDNIAEYIKFEDNLVQRGYDLKRLLEMMEKQTAKKVTSFDYHNGTVNYGCPVCKRKIISKIDGEWCGGAFNEYCDRCGQRLDWSEKR